MTKMTHTPTTARDSGRTRRLLLALMVAGVALLMVPSVASATRQLQFGDGTTGSKALTVSSIAVGGNSTVFVEVQCRVTGTDSGSCQTTRAFPTNPSGVFSDNTSPTSPPSGVCGGSTGSATSVFGSGGTSSKCTVAVKFTPTAATGYTGVATIGTSQGTLTLNLTATGLDGSPNLAVSPTTKDFGSIAVGETPTQTFTVTNTNTNAGAAAAQNLTATVTGDSHLTRTGGTCGTTLAANNGTCTVIVQYAPTDGSASNATLTIGATGATTRTIPLTGVGVPPHWEGQIRDTAGSAALTTYDFGPIAPTNTSTYAFKLHNTGNVPLGGTSNISLSGDTDQYALSPAGTCPATLAVGANCTIYVTFAPTVTSGTKTATLSVATGTDAGTLTVALSGAGTPQAPAAVIQDAAGATARPVQDFGTVQAPNTSSYGFKLRNTGNIPILNPTASISGADAASFGQTNNCPASLAVGATCTITVTTTLSKFDATTALLNVTTPTATVASTTLLLNLQGASSANDADTDAGSKRWLDTPTIGDASTTGIPAATANNEVRVSLDIPHSTSYRPSNLQVSSSNGATAPAQGDSSWQDVSSAELRQLPGSGNRTQINAAFSAAMFGWSGNTSPGVGHTDTRAVAALAGAGSVRLPQGYCDSFGTGTSTSGKMWFRVRDSEYSYSLPFSTTVKATRSTWERSNPSDFMLDTTNVSSLGLAWFTGDCVTAPPAVTNRAITQAGSTSYPFAAGEQDVKTTAGTPVTFTFSGHGGTYQSTQNHGFQILCLCTISGQGTSAGTFTGIQWRARNTVTGQVINGGTSTFSNTADGAQQSITTSFPSRGRWVVEGVPQGSNSTTAAGFYDYIGSVQVNAANAPTLSLTGVTGGDRLLSNHTYTLTANSSDVDPLGSYDPFGGLVSTIEWDLDNDHTNGPGNDGYETRTQASPYTGLTTAQLKKAFDTTAKTPGPYEICARVTDNGAYNGLDASAHTTEACVDVAINAPPEADDKTVDIEADDAQPSNIALTATDDDDDPWNVTVANQTGTGSVTDGAGDSADYTWPTTFAGTDHFTFVAHDDHDGTGTGDLTVNVHPATTLDASGAPHGTGPTNATQTRGATFTFTSAQTSVNAFECQLSTDPDGGTDFEVVEGEEWAPCSTGTKAYTGLDDGTYKAEVRAVTAGGLKDLSPAAYVWRVDTTKPEVVFHGTENAGPGGVLFTNDTTPSYTLTATDHSPQDGETYECRFPAGEGPWVPCGDPVGTSGSSPVDLVGPLFGITDPLEEGQYQLEARATDEAGNLGDAFTRSFTVDITPPVTSIVSGPEGLVNTRDVTYAVISNEAGSSFVCQLGERATEPDSDPSSWVPCPGANGAPAYTGLADGLYTFFVKAVDPAGNVAVDDPIESTDFEVDATAPETIEGELRDGDGTLLTGPEPSTQTRKATITFDGTDNRLLHGYECRLDSSASDAWQTCQSPESYGGLADGHHKIEVQAVDDAQNRDASPVVYEWYVDRTPPATTFDDHPGAYDNDATPTVTWHATDNVSTSGFTFQCNVDESAWATCDTPFDVAAAAGHDLADGPHTLAVRATDPAGNVEATAATLSWVVDTVAPAIELTAHPTGPIAPAGPADFGFRALDGTPPAAAPELTTECAVDEDLSTDPTGWTWTTCTSPHTIPAPSDGHHTFAVHSLDIAGNASAPQTYEWDVDATPPPAPRIDSSTPREGALTAATDATVAFSLEDENHITYQCRLDGAPWQDCPEIDDAGGSASQSPYTVTGLDDGAHQIDLRAIDEIGNVSPVSSLSWTVDHNLPSTHIDAGPSGTVRSAQATFSFSSNTVDNTFECRVDGAAWEACATPLSLTGLTEGAHSLSVRAVKGGVAPVGLRDPSPQTRSWTVDTTAPSLTVGDKPAESSTEKKAKFSFSSDDQTATFQCALDAGDFDTCASPLERTVAPGSHALKIRAVDAAGNASATETVSWVVTEEVPPESGRWLATLTDGTLAFQGLGAVPVPAGSLTLSGDLSNGAWHVGRGGVIVNPIVQNVEITPGATAALKITLSALQDGAGTLPADLSDGDASFNISLQVQVSAMLGALPIITDAQNCTVGPLELHGVGTYTKATQTIHIEDSNVHVPAAGLGCGTYGGVVNGLLHLPADGNAASFDFKLEKQEGEEPPKTTTQEQPPPNPPVTKTVETQTPRIVTPPAVPSLGTVSTKVPTNGKVKVPVWCVGRTTQTCAGTVSLAAKVGKKTTTLGKASYSVTGGKSKTITVTLSKAALKSLKAAKKGLKATLTVAPKTTAKIAKSVTLRRATSASKGGQK